MNGTEESMAKSPITFEAPVLNLHQARQLVEFFGGEEARVAVAHLNAGHSGPGVYAWLEEQPEEGSMFLPEADAASNEGKKK